jgi:acyl carrier protein
MTSVTEKSKQIVEQFWTAMQANDFKAAGEILHDDFVLAWPQSGERVRGRNAAILRARNSNVDLRPELALGSGGMDLDSIALVEVLLECETEFGVEIAAEMLSASSLTVGSLLERIQTLVQR